MSNVIILGDVHLGAGLNIGKIGIGSTLNSRITDQINLLDWVLDRAQFLEIHNLILTGDIFDDPKPDSVLISLFISWLKKCQVFDINVHLIAGNHDILRYGNIYTSPLDIISEMDMDHIFVYKDIDTIYLENSAFTLMPFRDRKSFNNSQSNILALDELKNSLSYELSSIPNNIENKIVIGHFALEGSIPIGNEFDDLNNELFCPLSMFQGYHSVFMGHVHKPQVLSKTPHIAHIGSMDISNFGETDHKKHIVIFNTISGSFTQENLPTRSLRKLSLSISPTEKDPTQYVLAEISKLSNLEKAIVKVEISSEAEKNINKSQIEAHLLNQGVHLVSQITESKKVNLVKKSTKSNQLDSKIDMVSALNHYAENYVPADSKAAFLEVALNIFNEFKSQ